MTRLKPNVGSSFQSEHHAGHSHDRPDIGLPLRALRHRPAAGCHPRWASFMHLINTHLTRLPRCTPTPALARPLSSMQASLSCASFLVGTRRNPRTWHLAVVARCRAVAASASRPSTSIACSASLVGSRSTRGSSGSLDPSSRPSSSPLSLASSFCLRSTWASQGALNEIRTSAHTSVVPTPGEFDHSPKRASVPPVGAWQLRSDAKLGPVRRHLRGRGGV
jgi:hypothetical protein